jgi:predicted kinase
MLSARASVRTHVNAHLGEIGAARAYLAAAIRHLEPPAPTLLAIGGLSGSGKTTLARRIAPRVGAAPGAVVLRSDEIRKRLAGVAPGDRLPPETYAPAVSERVYGEMFQVARRLLAAGRGVVLDAVFLRPAERAAAAALAEETGAPFRAAWLHGPRDLLAGRLVSRKGDASDAVVATLDEQLGRDPGPIDWMRVDASDLEAAAARLSPAPAD